MDIVLILYVRKQYRPSNHPAHEELCHAPASSTHKRSNKRNSNNTNSRTGSNSSTNLGQAAIGLSLVPSQPQASLRAYQPSGVILEWRAVCQNPCKVKPPPKAVPKTGVAAKAPGLGRMCAPACDQPSTFTQIWLLHSQNAG